MKKATKKAGKSKPVIQWAAKRLDGTGYVEIREAAKGKVKRGK